MLTVLDIENRDARQVGDQWLRQSLIGVMVAVILASGGWWMQAMESRLQANEEQLAIDRARQNADRERLATIEAQLRSQEQRLDTIATGLKDASAQIDAKLDRLIGMMVGNRRFDK